MVSQNFLKICIKDTRITEVNLSIFVIRLFREVFILFIRTQSPHERSENFSKQLVDKFRKINFSKSLCIKLTIKHSTTCDSKINLN